MKKLLIVFTFLFSLFLITSCVNFGTSIQGTWQAVEVNTISNSKDHVIPTTISISETSVKVTLALYIDGQGWVFSREILGITIPTTLEEVLDYYVSGRTLYAYHDHDSKGNPIVDFTLELSNGKLHYQDRFPFGYGDNVWFQRK